MQIKSQFRIIVLHMKQVKWMGILVFTVLGIASLWFYRERVIYLDSAYYAFSMINKDFPSAEHNRHALYLYQLIPWILLKLNTPVTLVLMAFSLCHTLLHAVAFYLLLRIRQSGLAAILVLMQVISYRECFFLAVNETALAISASLLLAGYLEYFREQRPKPLTEGLIYFSCTLTALFSHPMAMILIPFVIVYHLIWRSSANVRKQSVLLALAAFAGIFLLKKFTSQSSGYENDLFAQLGRTGEILGDLGNVYSFNFFFGEFRIRSYFFTIYIVPLAIAIYCTAMLIIRRQYLLLAFYMCSVIGFWLLIVIFFNRGDGNIFMEKNFTPWVLVSVYPLIHLVDAGRRSIRIPAMAISTGILLFSFYGMYQVTPMYKKRLYLMDQLITVKNPSGKAKLLIQDSTVNHDEWLGIWALPYETLLLSKVKKIPNTTARIYHNEEHINKELHRTDIFLGADFIPVLPASYLLNQKHFRLPEETYTLIEQP